MHADRAAVHGAAPVEDQQVGAGAEHTALAIQQTYDETGCAIDGINREDPTASTARPPNSPGTTAAHGRSAEERKSRTRPVPHAARRLYLD